MPTKSWIVQIEDGTHTVELTKKWFGGKRTIRVDGQIVDEYKPTWLDTGSDDVFPMGKHEGIIHSRPNGFTTSYDLSIDGISVQTGKATTRLKSMPKWAWAFIVACVIIPVITLGGAIPIVIGLSGAVGCAVISRHPTRSNRSKALRMLGVTALSWGLFAAFMIVVAGGMGLLTVT